MMSDDRQLLLATHRGHEASARLLWHRHGPRLLAHARAILRNASAADDVVQTVMCRILELPKSRLAAVNDVAAFLSSAVRNEAANYLRATRREQARRLHAANGESIDGAKSELAGDVASAVERLPRRLREIVVLKHAGMLTFDQIASVLATNRNTVAGRYRAAIESLRSILSGSCVAGGVARE